ncbi:MAG: hypothetical protein GXP49_17195 [Deltaproteobacteria bacterium]|nr:hypothetical protein [Deltaproteobacteria bacterium]
MSRFEYRNGRFYKDNEPFFVIGAEYQYYRDLPENWGPRLDQIKKAGVNVVTFYIPWRHHLTHGPGGEFMYDFGGHTKPSRDLLSFIELCEKKGLFMIAKPGPFVHSELNIGGLPDVTSPTFNKEICSVRMHDGQELLWDYDDTALPSVFDPGFDEMAQEWLSNVGRVLRPHASPGGGIIALQLLDETLYCTSNSPPWSFGYEAPSIKAYHEMLLKEYGSLEAYNTAHNTNHESLCLVQPPKLGPGKPAVMNLKDALQYKDWGKFQWKLRRDAYARYKRYLGVDLPCLSNFAGITPPIEENVPGKDKQKAKRPDTNYDKLYSEWWLAQNRVDLDEDIYHYGIISWLGVAAYGIEDARSMPDGKNRENKVFYRYINTARRRRGINMEENWGFAKLYHPMSKYPFIPVFQTLVSVAGGCTGYVAFTAVSHKYWDPELDRITKKISDTFPSDAPIGPNGDTGGMYNVLCMLNEWFQKEGKAFLETEPLSRVCLLSMPDQAAVSSFVPGEEQWKVDAKIPRVGYSVLEPASMSLAQSGIPFSIIDSPAASRDILCSYRAVLVPSAFFMSRNEQEILAGALEAGANMLFAGELPFLDDKMQPCKILKDKIEQLEGPARAGPHRAVKITSEDISDTNRLKAILQEFGVESEITLPQGVAAYLFGNERTEHGFLFFFHLESTEDAEKTITVGDREIRMRLGPRSSGVIHLAGDEILSLFIKATNEYEGIEAGWSIATASSRLEGKGDTLWFKRG